MNIVRRILTSALERRLVMPPTVQHEGATFRPATVVAFRFDDATGCCFHVDGQLLVERKGQSMGLWLFTVRRNGQRSARLPLAS